MAVQNSEAGRLLARARWGERPRTADRALDQLTRYLTDLAPDQLQRLRDLAAERTDPMDYLRSLEERR